MVNRGRRINTIMFSSEIYSIVGDLLREKEKNKNVVFYSAFSTFCKQIQINKKNMRV